MKRWEVYWITDDPTADIKTYGYVGITSQGVQTRYKAHRRSSRKKKYKAYWRELSKAFRAAGGELDIFTVCICDKEYARYLENSLRPSENIGWNLAAGGFVPVAPTEEVKKSSAEKRRATLETRGGMPSGEQHPRWKGGVKAKQKARSLEVKKLKELGLWKRPPITEETRLKLKARPRRSGFKISEEQKDALRDYMIARAKRDGPWCNVNARQDMWGMAQILYEEWVKCPCGAKALSTRVKVLFNKSFYTLTRMFADGWVPIDDDRWCLRYGNKESEETTQ